MTASAKRKCFFLLLVAFFVLFGGGRSERWSIVCQDQQGWTYEIDISSINKQSDETIALRVKSERDGHWRIDDWLLDPTHNALSIESGPQQAILFGSVAAQVMLQLRERGVLRPSSLEQSRASTL